MRQIFIRCESRPLKSRSTPNLYQSAASRKLVVRSDMPSLLRSASPAIAAVIMAAGACAFSVPGAHMSRARLPSSQSLRLRSRPQLVVCQVRRRTPHKLSWTQLPAPRALLQTPTSSPRHHACTTIFLHTPACTWHLPSGWSCNVQLALFHQERFATFSPPALSLFRFVSVPPSNYCACLLRRAETWARNSSRSARLGRRWTESSTRPPRT